MAGRKKFVKFVKFVVGKNVVGKRNWGDGVGKKWWVGLRERNGQKLIRNDGCVTGKKSVKSVKSVVEKKLHGKEMARN